MNKAKITLYFVLLAITPLLGESVGDDDLSTVTGESSRIEALRTEQIEAFMIQHEERRKKIDEEMREARQEQSASQMLDAAEADLVPFSGVVNLRRQVDLEQTLIYLEGAYTKRYAPMLSKELRERWKNYVRLSKLNTQKSHFENALKEWQTAQATNGYKIDKTSYLNVITTIERELARTEKKARTIPDPNLTPKEMNALRTEAILTGTEHFSGERYSTSYRAFVEKQGEDRANDYYYVPPPRGF